MTFAEFAPIGYYLLAPNSYHQFAPIVYLFVPIIGYHLFVHILYLAPQSFSLFVLVCVLQNSQFEDSVTERKYLY